MYQLTVSVNERYADWLYSIEDIMKNKLESCSAVAAVDRLGKRYYCCFGCEDNSRDLMIDAVKECLVEMYAVVIKFDFIKRNLNINLSELRYEMLLHTLVAFDRENEHKLLRKKLTVTDGMALDGVFDFMLGELKERWLEICNLTKVNGMYLHDDETYNELLRFLISAVNPKINKLTVYEDDGKYRLRGTLKNDKLDIGSLDFAELMYCLIDLAPLELIIAGGISNKEVSGRLIGIFDAKTSDKVENKSKK